MCRCACRSSGVLVDIEQAGDDLRPWRRGAAGSPAPRCGRAARSRRRACAAPASSRRAARRPRPCPARNSTSIGMRLVMKSSRFTASLCSRTKSKLLVEPAWLLKATQGLITSMKAAPLCAIAALMIGTSCVLSPEKERATKLGAELQRHGDQVDGIVGVDEAALRLGAAVGGGRELALGQAVNAVVLHDIDHVDAAADRMRELAKADRGRVAVAGDAEIDQVAVGEIGAGQHRRHAPVHRIEAVRIAEEIGRRLRRAADAGNLGHAVRLDRQLEAGLDDRGGDRVVAAAGAQRRHRAFVVAVGVAERRSSAASG